MNILYLTEDYFHSKVHNNLLTTMLQQNENLTIYVFIPIRPRVGENLCNSFNHHDRLIEIAVPIDIPLFIYRFDFWAKIRCKVRLIEKYVPLNRIDVIHAATVYTEGCTALALRKKYDIPYLLSVRGTDCDFYSQKMFHLWHNAYSAISNASIVVFITPMIKIKMLKKWQFRGIRKNLESGIIVNNGIDDIWLDNLNLIKKRLSTPIRILYIGRFDYNKNVKRLIESVSFIHKKYPVLLTLIGGDGEEQEVVEHYIENNSDYMEYLGKIYDKHQLISIVRQCDIFAMVSHGETFGLVYAECLSQKLPILYSTNTGFDGMYPQGYVGYGVDSMDVKSIEKGLLDIINNYEEIEENIEKLDFSKYNWKSIALKYINQYANIINSK